MRRIPPLAPLLLLALSLVAPSAGAETWFWVDEDGVTHISDDPSALPAGARPTGEAGGDDLRRIWDSVGGDEPVRAPADGAESARIRRLLRGALADLERGETARATAALTGVLRLEPSNAEAHWQLARLDRERGRWESSEVHLRAFLASAGEGMAARRAEAHQRLAALADERRLADPGASADTRWMGIEDKNFRVSYHSALAEASPDYAATVLRFLNEARERVEDHLGAVPQEPMGVMFYGRAAYLRAHSHRFSFQTVGFFDGRIHVVSAAHPSSELRGLLFHEYTHAVFREQTGGDRPFWLNEGLAELSERVSRGPSGLTRGERSALRGRIEGGTWLPLRRLAAGFSGLDNEDARAAYLESTAAASWLGEQTDRDQRARILHRLGAGDGIDDALREAVGLDTDGVDAAVRGWILEEFPASDLSS